MEKIKTLAISIIFPILLLNCSTQKKLTKLDDKMTIIKKSSYTKFMIGKDYTLWKTNDDDLKKVDKLLVSAIDDGRFFFLEKNQLSEIKKYYRQYLCYVNENGEKIIFINSFCDLSDYVDDYSQKTKLNWKKDMLNVADGGDCYWNIKININTNEYFELKINMQG